MKHEHTDFVAASPERVFGALADIGNLPRYVPQVTGAERLDGDKIKVQARYEGHTQEGEAWFRADASERKIEWGSPGSEYRGSIQVSPEGDGSRLTLYLATARGDAPDSEVMGTLDAIRRLVEADV
jgi:Polyketide cyclase / dehydrase and lipid transport